MTESPPQTTSRRNIMLGAAGLASTACLSGCDSGGSQSAPITEETAWNGFGGVGDYAEANGNVWSVVQAAHSNIKDGENKAHIARSMAAKSTETTDILIVGSGIAGLAAAHAIHEEQPDLRVLLLDNSAMFGGESRQNEFDVDGVRLFAPQGASGFGIPDDDDVSPAAILYRKLGIPKAFSYRAAQGTQSTLEFDRSNFGYKFKSDISSSWGWHFGQAHGVQPRWERNIWANDLADAPFAIADRSDLLRWRKTDARPFKGSDEATARWLDTMSYGEYLASALDLGDAPARYIDAVIGVDIAGGVGLSALVARGGGYPGFIGLGGTDNSLRRYADIPRGRREAFPGGNAGLARYLVKVLQPDAIAGDTGLHDVLTGSIDARALDRAGATVRIRQGATVVAVHQQPGKSGVDIVYRLADDVRHIRARSVVMASGSWVNKHICHGMPDAYLGAMAQFSYTPVVVANVALRNWRFMDRLGMTAVRWFEGPFGFAANIRTPMNITQDTAPLAPDLPAVMTFYVPFGQMGKTLVERGALGRADIYATAAATFEARLRQQMTHLFGDAGFDADKDIAAVILNRWGHAYSNPWPGFYHGEDGAPPVRDLLRKPWGRIAFGHSDLAGKQTFVHAVEEGTRAARQALDALA